jgi:ATP-dependent Lon protease
VGVIGFWDVVAFDEVGTMKVKDQDTIQLMKDYMANGRFSRGTDVIANASMAFIGNIDDSVEQIANSNKHDLFKPLPKAFDLALLHRMYYYLPGWEVAQPGSEMLTNNFGFITDYLAEAMHHQAKSQNRSSYVQSNCKLGPAIIGRDEKAIIKTVSAFLKLLHPHGDPEPEELNEYLEYALEGRRRVKEQLNKRKNDDEFAEINFTYFSQSGEEVEVFCPESEGVAATQNPRRKNLDGSDTPQRQSDTEEFKAPAEEHEVTAAFARSRPDPGTRNLFENESPPAISILDDKDDELTEKHYKIHYGSKGYGYESQFMPYMLGSKSIRIEDPYIRAPHQTSNFLRFCEVIAKAETIRNIELVTGWDNDEEKDEVQAKLFSIADSLKEWDIKLAIKFDNQIHDREISLSNGWIIKIGRGLDYFQRPDDWMSLGVNDLDLRPCLETSVDIYKSAG